MWVEEFQGGENSKHILLGENVTCLSKGKSVGLACRELGAASSLTSSSVKWDHSYPLTIETLTVNDFIVFRWVVSEVKVKTFLDGAGCWPGLNNVLPLGKLTSPLLRVLFPYLNRVSNNLVSKMMTGLVIHSGNINWLPPYMGSEDSKRNQTGPALLELIWGRLGEVYWVPACWAWCYWSPEEGVFILWPCPRKPLCFWLVNHFPGSLTCYWQLNETPRT